MSAYSLSSVFRSAIFSGLAFLSVATSSQASVSGILSDSGFDGPPYEEIVANLKKLAETYPDLAETFTYGESMKGQPLVGLRVQSIRNPGANAPLAVINGAIHGNEFLGVEDRLAAWILESGIQLPSFQTFLSQGGAIIVVPVMNPDGYIADRRGNARDKDLNRDFELRRTRHAASKEKETQYYSAFLKNELATSGRKLRFTLDYHCCIGALLIPWSYGHSIPMEAADVARFNVVKGYAREALGTPTGTPAEILGYTADGTTMDHFFEAHGTLAVAYEGAYRTENRNFTRHTRFLERVITGLNEGL